jgi:hypothetical protein
LKALTSLFIFLNMKIYVILVIIVYRRRCVNRSSHWNLTQIQMWFKLEFFEPLLLISQPFHLLIFLSSFFSPKLTLLGAWVTHFATLSNNYCLHGIDSKFEIQVVDGNSFQNTQIVCILSFNSIFLWHLI